MTFRIQWQRDGKGGFIAYPEGENLKGRYAAISYSASSSVHWQWWVIYDEARRSDHAHTRQGASDAVNQAWPVMKAEAARLAGIAAEEEALATNVRRMMSKGDLPLSIFGIEASPAKRLTHIIWLVRDAGGLDGPARPLVEACSAELFRRRAGG